MGGQVTRSTVASLWQPSPTWPVWRFAVNDKRFAVNGIQRRSGRVKAEVTAVADVTEFVREKILQRPSHPHVVTLSASRKFALCASDWCVWVVTLPRPSFSGVIETGQRTYFEVSRG